MKVLLIETCGSEASIALADTDASPAIVASIVMPGRTASERLIGQIRDGMAGKSWTLHELTAIVVVRGPGSFTGVRVGLSAAKGLSEACGVSLLGISRLAMLAAASQAPDGDSDAEESEVCAILDAGRGEFYCGRYIGGRCLGEWLLSLELAVELAKSVGLVVVCEAKVEQAFAGFSNDRTRVRLVSEPTAAHALPLAHQRLLDSEYDDAAQIDANYLRSSDQQIFAKPGPSSKQSPLGHS